MYFLLNSVKISPVAHIGFYKKATVGVFIPSEVNVTIHHHLRSRLKPRETVNPAIHTSSESAALLSTATILHRSGWNSVIVHW
jgi:hypothetical protein